MATHSPAWMPVSYTHLTDQLRGGTSTVTLSVVPEAKRGRNRVLSVAGDLAAGPAAWAGAAFFPGATPMAPANLTTATTLEFRARGPGRVVVMLFTAQGGAMPAATSIAIGPTLGTHRVALRDLVVDPYDVTMIFIGQAPLDDAGAPRSGPFHFELDDVRLR